MPVVLCAGNILVDILARPVGREIAWQATTWIDEIAQRVGGNAANTSCALGRMGVAVRVLGAVGNDPFGEFALGHLREAGVDTTLVERVDLATGSTSVLVREDGARALLHCPGASAVALRGGIEFPERATHLHLANPFSLRAFRGRAAETLVKARMAGLSTSLDTGHDAMGEWMAVIGPCLPYLDVLLVNEDEARALTGLGVDEAAASFLRAGTLCVTVKLGAAGCAVYGKEAFRSPGFRVPVVDTTGAGDCFAGGFVARYVEGAAPEECALWGNALGALNVQAVGGTTGLRPRAEVEAWLRDECRRR